MKKLTLLLLIATVFVTAFAFSACGEKKPDTGKNETNPPANQVENIKKDPVVYSVVGSVKSETEIIEYRGYSVEDLTLIDSSAQLDGYGLIDGYDASFFDTKSLIIMGFAYNSSEENIEFKSLLSNGNKLYALFELDGVKQNQPSCNDIKYNLYFAEVEKSAIEGYTMGSILTVNRRDSASGACYHERFNGIIK